MDVETLAVLVLSDKNVVAVTAHVPLTVLVANAETTDAEETPADLVRIHKHAKTVCVLEVLSEVAETESVVMTELEDPVVHVNPDKDAEEESVNVTMIVLTETVEQQSLMLDLSASPKVVELVPQDSLAVPLDSVLLLLPVMSILWLLIRSQTRPSVVSAPLAFVEFL